MNIPLYLIIYNFRALPTIRAFLISTVLYDVIFSSALGIGIGYILRKALKIARKNDYIDRESMLVFSLAIAMLVIGIGSLIGTNELLACFFAGTALNWSVIRSLGTSMLSGTEIVPSLLKTGQIKYVAKIYIPTLGMSII